MCKKKEYLVEEITGFAREKGVNVFVYHGSTEIIKNPDVVHSKKYLDFGRGFYIT